MAGRSTTSWYKEKEKDSPIKLATEVKPEKLEETTIYGWDSGPDNPNRRERRSKAFIHGAENPELLLTCTNQFNQLRVDLQLFNNDLFVAYRKTLKIGLQSIWDAHVGQIPRTTANFDNRLHSFLTKYTKRGLFERFQEYFVVVCKHVNLDVMAMHTRLELILLSTIWEHTTSLCSSTDRP